MQRDQDVIERLQLTIKDQSTEEQSVALIAREENLLSSMRKDIPDLSENLEEAHKQLSELSVSYLVRADHEFVPGRNATLETLLKRHNLNEIIDEFIRRIRRSTDQFAALEELQHDYVYLVKVWSESGNEAVIDRLQSLKSKVYPIIKSILLKQGYTGKFSNYKRYNLALLGFEKIQEGTIYLKCEDDSLIYKLIYAGRELTGFISVDKLSIHPNTLQQMINIREEIIQGIVDNQDLPIFYELDTIAGSTLVEGKIKIREGLHRILHDNQLFDTAQFCLVLDNDHTMTPNQIYLSLKNGVISYRLLNDDIELSGEISVRDMPNADLMPTANELEQFASIKPIILGILSARGHLPILLRSRQIFDSVQFVEQVEDLEPLKIYFAFQDGEISYELIKDGDHLQGKITPKDFLNPDFMPVNLDQLLSIKSVIVKILLSRKHLHMPNSLLIKEESIYQALISQQRLTSMYRNTIGREALEERLRMLNDTMRYRRDDLEAEKRGRIELERIHSEKSSRIEQLSAKSSLSAEEKQELDLIKEEKQDLAADLRSVDRRIQRIDGVIKKLDTEISELALDKSMYEEVQELYKELEHKATNLMEIFAFCRFLDSEIHKQRLLLNLCVDESVPDIESTCADILKLYEVLLDELEARSKTQISIDSREQIKQSLLTLKNKLSANLHINIVARSDAIVKSIEELNSALAAEQQALLNKLEGKTAESIARSISQLQEKIDSTKQIQTKLSEKRKAIQALQKIIDAIAEDDRKDNPEVTSAQMEIEKHNVEIQQLGDEQKLSEDLKEDTIHLEYLNQLLIDARRLQTLYSLPSGVPQELALTNQAMAHAISVVNDFKDRISSVPVTTVEIFTQKLEQIENNLDIETQKLLAIKSLKDKSILLENLDNYLMGYSILEELMFDKQLLQARLRCLAADGSYKALSLLQIDICLRQIDILKKHLLPLNDPKLVKTLALGIELCDSISGLINQLTSEEKKLVTAKQELLSERQRTLSVSSMKIVVNLGRQGYQRVMDLRRHISDHSSELEQLLMVIDEVHKHLQQVGIYEVEQIKELLNYSHELQLDYSLHYDKTRDDLVRSVSSIDRELTKVIDQQFKFSQDLPKDMESVHEYTHGIIDKLGDLIPSEYKQHYQGYLISHIQGQVSLSLQPDRQVRQAEHENYVPLDILPVERYNQSRESAEASRYHDIVSITRSAFSAQEDSLARECERQLSEMQRQVDISFEDELSRIRSRVEDSRQKAHDDLKEYHQDTKDRVVLLASGHNYYRTLLGEYEVGAKNSASMMEGIREESSRGIKKVNKYS